MLDSPYNDRLLENIPLKLMIKLFSWEEDSYDI